MVTNYQVRQAIADQLSTTFSTVTDITIHVEPLAFSVAEVPAVDMYPIAATGLETGLAAYSDMYGALPLNIRVRVTPADIEAGEQLLDALMDDVGDLSILAALDSDHTLGGVAQDINWADGYPWGGYIDFPAPEDKGVFLGSLLPIIVIKAHS